MSDILSALSEYRIVAITGSRAVMAYLDVVRKCSALGLFHAEFQNLYCGLQVNDVDFVVGDNKKHFDGFSVMPQYIGGYLRQGLPSKSGTRYYKNDQNTFDLIYAPNEISYVEIEGCNYIDPSKLLEFYKDDLDLLKGTKRTQADLKIRALELIIASWRDLGLVSRQSVRSYPEFGLGTFPSVSRSPAFELDFGDGASDSFEVRESSGFELNFETFTAFVPRRLNFD